MALNGIDCTTSTTRSMEQDSGISEYGSVDDSESQVFENRCGLSQDLRFLSGMPELCDVMFLVGEEREAVYGVKAILAIRSRVFYKMLYGPKSNCKQQQQRLISSNGGQSNGGTMGKRFLQKMLHDHSNSSNNNPLTALTRGSSPHGTARSTNIGYHKGPSTSGQQKTVVYIDEFEAEVFKQLLEYIHTGSVVLLPKTLLGLLNAADHFGLEELRRACAEFSQKCISVDTVCSLLVTADYYIQYKSTKIFVQRVLDFVVQHGDEILQLREFVHLPRHVVELILSREELEASEINKYRACERWSRHYVLYNPTDNVRQVMTQFTKYIAFHTIPTNIIMREIRPHSIVNEEILMSCLAYQADPQSVSPQELVKLSPRRQVAPQSVANNIEKMKNTNRHSIAEFFPAKNAKEPLSAISRSNLRIVENGSTVSSAIIDEEVDCRFETLDCNNLKNEGNIISRRSRSVDRNLSKCSNEGSQCDSGYNDESTNGQSRTLGGATVVRITDCDDEAYGSGGRAMSCYDLVDLTVNFKF